MKILVVNSGSSSVKYQAFDMDSLTVLASGLVERIGEPMGRIVHTIRPGSGEEKDIEDSRPFPDHAAGLQAAIAWLEDKTDGVIESAAEIEAVAHRVVHGGEHFSAPAIIDERVIQAIRDTIPLAPLHNPAHLLGIETAMALFPKAVQVAVFDTAFHQTMPKRAFLYALPHELYERRHIRRYGFHGTSHFYVAKQAAEFLGKPLEACDLITLHLGNGCSAAAIKNGKSVDTSMGMTPLAGLIMGTRCGDLDPQAALFLAMQENMPVAEIDDMLNKKSGLLGICGVSDMRDIHQRRQAGDERAQLAFEMFCYSIRKYLGSYLAALGRADAVVFTAGIGEHDGFTRKEAIKGLEGLGLVIDPEKNAAPGGGEREISRVDSPVKVLVIPTNEELEIARQTMQTLNEQ
jgi:acetate kinase